MGANHQIMSSTNEIRAALLDPFEMLDPRERKFATYIAAGMNSVAAANAAGYKKANHLGTRLIRRPAIARAIKYIADENRKAAQMTRKKVMDGFLDAIDMARVQGDPATMVSGWREVGKMCGLYEPEKKTLDVNITAKRVIEKLETLSTEELYEFIAEGEYTDVTPDQSA